MRRPLATALLACMLAAAVHGDYKDAYRKGIQARNRGRWAEVARFMREAIAEESRETGERVNISGMDFEPYLPHYYLGLALYNAADCVGALASWQASDAQGTVRRLPEGANLLKHRKECETTVAASGRPVPPTGPAKPVLDKPGPAPPTPSPVPSGPDPAAVSAAVQNAAAAIAKAEEAAKAVSSFETESILAPVWKTEAALGPADQNARNALNGARADLDAGRKDSNLQRLQQAAAVAASAAQLFENVRRAAGARRDELQRIAAETALRPLRPEPPAAGPVTPTGNANVAKPPDNVKPPPATPAFTPPPALIGAARLFFSSRYQEASDSLGRLRFTSGPAAAHAALLRATTYYSLYLVGGEKDATLLEQARQQVLGCRRLGPGLQPDPQAFSPRFIAYFATAK